MVDNTLRAGCYKTLVTFEAQPRKLLASYNIYKYVKINIVMEYNVKESMFSLIVGRLLQNLIRRLPVVIHVLSRNITTIGLKSRSTKFKTWLYNALLHVIGSTQ